MSLNKNALIRYKTIDKCLQNIYKEWTLEDLILSCSEALYEYEGRQINVSKRTVQLDIQFMRSDKLGYNAPIEVYDKKYYRYGEPNFTITKIPINEGDMHVLSETVELLKQFKDFSLFSELGGLIQRLEDQVYSEKSKKPNIIHLDKNENLKGLEHLDLIYQAILKQIVLKMTYKSFRARKESTYLFSPYLLKEFNNRWFVVGKVVDKGQYLTLALDRIELINLDFSADYIEENFNGDDFYKDTIGVTVLGENQVKKVVLKLDSSNAPYVLTKPFHSSQKVLEQDKEGSVIIQIKVHLNYELERLILGFGDSIEVLKPRRLRGRIKEKLSIAASKYK